MGYECKLYIVDTYGDSECPLLDMKTKTKTYAREITSYDLSKMGDHYHDLLNKAPKTKSYIYAKDGDTETLKDPYGDELREFTLAELIPVLEKEQAENHYRRLPPIIAMLKEFERLNKGEWGGHLRVLHYGH